MKIMHERAYAIVLLALCSFLIGYSTLTLYVFSQNEFKDFLINHHHIQPYVEEFIKLVAAGLLVVLAGSGVKVDWIKYAVAGFIVGITFGLYESLIVYSHAFWNRLELTTLLHGFWTLVPVMTLFNAKKERLDRFFMFLLMAIAYSGTLHLFFNGFVDEENFTFVEMSSIGGTLFWLLSVASGLIAVLWKPIISRRISASFSVER